MSSPDKDIDTHGDIDARFSSTPKGSILPSDPSSTIATSSGDGKKSALTDQSVVNILVRKASERFEELLTEIDDPIKAAYLSVWHIQPSFFKHIKVDDNTETECIHFFTDSSRAIKAEGDLVRSGTTINADLARSLVVPNTTRVLQDCLTHCARPAAEHGSK